MEAVGGVIEAAAGTALAAAASWTGIGLLAGGAVAAHGFDVALAGIQQAVTGQSTDSLTSDALQSAGLSRSTANAIDSGISFAGSLGSASAAASIGAVDGLVGQNFGKLGTVVENPGQQITGFTYHGFNMADIRGLYWDVMQNAVENPVVVLRQSAGQSLYLSEDAAVVLDPSGRIVTTYSSADFDSVIQSLVNAAKTPSP